MNKEMKSIALLYSHITSLLILIIVTWVWGDSESAKDALQTFGVSSLQFELTITLLLVFISSLLIYKSFKDLINRKKKGHGDKSE
ncbi:hypothetical protein [Fluviispira sanaruensis]|uniref:Uncharacterized protein n=1 Tax=Fluviispira sanaruensis TaxID=2493639 RepID=A0A4P2VNE3_FLUSA|nr:hypothetical protein [Fluviispira sanaruensis]BBH54611.1 hypothetical protein JCM31447_30850 [Fluviispira sanaruensis]